VTIRYGFLLVAAALCAQQPHEPEEVRVSSQPYAPQPPAAALRVETRLVDISAAVRDGHGRAVAGLTRDEFRIWDDGKAREIVAFSQELAASGISAPAPAAAAVPGKSAETTATAPANAEAPARFVALFFDDVNAKDGTSAGDLKRTQTAAARYLKDALQPGVRIGLFTASGQQTVGFTADAARLGEAVGALKPHQRVSENGLTFCPRITPYRAYQVAELHSAFTIRLLLMEAAAKESCPANQASITDQAGITWRRVREASLDTLAAIGGAVDALAKMPGKRMLLMASSGFVAETLEPQQDQIIDRALRAGVTINALDSKGIYSEPEAGTRPDDGQIRDKSYDARLFQWQKLESMELPARLLMVDQAMANLTQGTGGLFFRNNNDFHAGFRQLGTPPEVTYHMSFRPEGTAADGAYHKLKVELVHAGANSVEARPGYFAPQKAAAAAETPRAKIDREVMASDVLQDVPAGLAIQVGKPSESERTLSVIVSVDIAKLAFAVRNDRKVQQITFVTAMLDSAGKLVAAKEGRMDLALTAETYERLAKTGVNAKLTFQMAPGMYRLREVVEEAVHGAVSSSTNAVDLR
jgi:VWFA-related protein